MVRCIFSKTFIKPTGIYKGMYPIDVIHTYFISCEKMHSSTSLLAVLLFSHNYGTLRG